MKKIETFVSILAHIFAKSLMAKIGCLVGLNIISVLFHQSLNTEIENFLKTSKLVFVFQNTIFVPIQGDPDVTLEACVQLTLMNLTNTSFCFSSNIKLFTAPSFFFKADDVEVFT